MPDDDVYWSLLTEKIKPLPGRNDISVTVIPPKKVQVREREEVAAYNPKSQNSLHKKVMLNCGATSGIDKNLRQKMDSGKIPIDAKVDLHHMTQEQAHATLQSFINTAFMRQYRMLLVITGKGKEGKGLLRMNVEAWLNEASVAPKIVRFSQAILKDGGEGAFYVLLKRHRE